MSIHQHKTIADTIYFWFASNDTSGSGGDGANPVFFVRLAGAAAGAAPVLSDGATLLTHADFPDGCHEVAIPATVGNGFAAGNTYSAYCTLLVDSQNPTGFIGSFTLVPIISNVIEIEGADPTDTIRDSILSDGTRFDGGNIDAAISSRGTADPGDLMGLISGAITSAKYDESTAFPVVSSDSGVTRIARTGSDGDTLGTLSDEIATRAPSGEYNTQLDATVSSRSSHTATNVWAVGTRTLTSFGSLIADIWAYVTRTLTAVPPDGATETKQDLIQADLDLITGSDGATLATAQGNYAPSKAGDEMALIDDAITSAKYDESTAFPVKSADTGATQIARVGSDGDTLKTLSDQLDLVQAKTDNLPSGIAKNVALPDFEFLMVDSTDHVTGKTGLTVTSQISKDGGAFANATNNATEVSGGVYKIDWTQAEINVDTATFKFTATGADQRTVTIFTS